MKKQTVTLLLSLLVVLALLGLMIFLMVRFQSGEEQEEQTVGSSQEETVLMQVAADAINTLSIENPSDSFTLVNEGDGFVVEGLEDVSVSSLNVNNLVDLFAPLTAQRQLLSAEELTVGDSGEQLMQYGLDNPEYIIRIVTTDGAELTLELGNSALDGSSVYALYEGGVYLISDDILDSVSKTRYSFLDNEITEVEPSDYDKAVIELSGTVRPQTITLEIDTVESEEETESSEDEAVVSSIEKQYTLTTPTVQTITEASASQVTDGLYSLYANQIAAVNPTEEELAAYGLDEPYSVVSVSIDGVEQFTLRASERNSNNYVYMTKDGSPFVYLVSASRLSWLTVQVEQLTQSVHEPVELDELSSLTVESTDQSYTFLVTQGEEQTVTGNGEEVDSELFAELYRTITAIPPDELSSGEPSLEKVLSMTVRYLDEGRQEDVFELYPTGDGNVYISLNGEIRYTVSQDVVYQILDNCQNVLDGGEVSALA